MTKVKTGFLCLLSIILITSTTKTSFPQGNVNYNIKVTNNDHIPVPNLAITAVETTSLITTWLNTNSDGVAPFQLKNGKEWKISVGLMKNTTTVASAPFQESSYQQIFIYDMEEYERKKLQNPNRTDSGFIINSSPVTKTQELASNKSMVQFTLVHPEGKRLSNINISVVSLKEGTIFRGLTNSVGEVNFIVPNNTNYDIDINSYLNYSYVDIGTQSSIWTHKIEFAPTEVNEKMVNDTIIQKVYGNSKPSTNRALVQLNVKGQSSNRNDNKVYLRDVKTNQVYSSKLNDNNTAYFLVPNFNVYMVDFKYQDNADAINLSNLGEMATVNATVRYFPNPRLEFPEEYLPTPDNLLIKNLNSFLDKQFEKPIDKPFLLKVFPVLEINKESKEALFVLELGGSEVYGKDHRIPLNLSFVIDKSGSMFCCKRTESIKRSLWELGNVLKPEDHVSFVLFDTSPITVQNNSNSHIKTIEDIIENYQPNGGTNIYFGIQEGVHNIETNFNQNHSNKVILLTDGYGITPTKDITTYVESKYDEGIEFSTIGIGEDYNYSLLNLMAQKGNGTMSYVQNPSILSDVLLQEVKDAFSYLAKDVKIKITYNNEMIFSSLYGYPIKNVGNGTVEFEIGKIPKGLDKIGFLKFKLDNPSAKIEDLPVKIEVSYFDLVANKNITYTKEVKLNWTEETSIEMEMDNEEKKLYVIAILNQSIKNMAEHYANGNNSEAKKALKDGIKQTEDIFPESKPKEVKQLFKEVKLYSKMMAGF